MNTINTINTITHRGILCIDTFPLELVWGKSHTVLECNNCLEYATFKNVLVGLCINCAMHSYSGKYGNGFFNFPSSNNFNNEISLCFGNIHPLHILNIKGVEYKQKALNNFESYSIYNLSLSSLDELAFLCTSPFNIYGLYEFQKHYNCDLEVLQMILDKVKEHKLTFNIWNNEYYAKCLKIEHFFKTSYEDYKIQNEIANENENNKNNLNKRKYPCSYCNTYKLKIDLKKCSRCGNSRYCSIACQTRDWKNDHKLDCNQEQDLENHAHKDDAQDLENPANKYSANVEDNEDSEDGEDNEYANSYKDYESDYDDDFSIHQLAESDLFSM